MRASPAAATREGALGRLQGDRISPRIEEPELRDARLLLQECELTALRGGLSVNVQSARVCSNSRQSSASDTRSERPWRSGRKHSEPVVVAALKSVRREAIEVVR